MFHTFGPRRRGGTVTLATTADLVASAAAGDTAVLALNVGTIEHAEGIADGVERAGVAVLMQLSENTVLFHGGRIAPPSQVAVNVGERDPR
jgi:fructose-bisphosphate aldolase, class II